MANAEIITLLIIYKAARVSTSGSIAASATVLTAAIIKNLDLVVTVDTAIAHLAGGLGAQVWLLHPYATADWRWICHRTDSYWYPGLRIFKQQKPFDYDGVMKNVHAALKQLVAQQ